jgi:two-component system, OmpR family, phosphate regulon response regulator OmpR
MLDGPRGAVRYTPAMERADHVLVVDDDAEIRKLLGEYLERNGFRVSLATDGTEMRRALDRSRPDIVVLDLMLPGDSGLKLCRDLRVESSLPVIMLTARAEEVDRIVGLEMGADDYLPKPFNPRELVARIHAVLRRQRAPEMPGAPSADERVVEFGPYALNLATRALSRDGENVPLTTGEFSLLKALASHPREPMSRDKLMELARGREHESYDRSIDVQVSRLRRLLGEDPQSPRFIQTVWGFGYVFVPDGAPAK